MRTLLSYLLIVMLLFGSLPVTNIAAAQTPDPDSATVTIDAKVVEELETTGSSSYWVEFNTDFSSIKSVEKRNWSEQGWYVYQSLSSTAKNSQADMIKYLTRAGIPFRSFWIKNTILIEESDVTTLNQITKFSGVTSIEGRKNYILYEPERNSTKSELSLFSENTIQTVETNLTHIQADDVWGLGIDGAGIVVAGIDTGVRYTHEALVNQYRGNQGDGSFDHDYNWLDPYAVYASPADDHGHGTHTMGTMVGDDGADNQIGVAPGAQWMACRGCTTSGCSDTALLACGQFITAPTTVDGLNPNPDYRPNVVNNSWGDCGTTYDPWYEDVINAWHAAGIYPVFSNGNAGNCGYTYPPGLNTVGNPARTGSVTGVGSSGNQNGEYATHSNWGPTDNPDTVNPVSGFETLKPQVIAPGVDIRSSTPGSDTEYQDGWSGTSMSAPHVSGLVALMWSAAPCLNGDYATTETMIEETATDIVYDDGSFLTPTNFPNFATGWGEINALAAVEAAVDYCALSTISGTVTDSASGNPLENAQVVLTAQTASGTDRISYTNTSGEYVAYVEADTYDMVVTKFGYQSGTIQDIVVAEDSAVIQDIALSPLPVSTVSGVVTDGGVSGGDLHGYPLYASLTFSALGESISVSSDPFSGAYTVELYQGLDYQVEVHSLIAGGYQDYNDTFTVVSEAETQDYSLFVTNFCSAPGYEADITTSLSEGFESGSLPAGWENHDYQGNGQVWLFNDPDGRGNMTPGGDGGFAILDSDYYPITGVQNAGLRTPVMDLSSHTYAILQFDSHYRHNTDSSAAVRVSTDGGSTWDSIWTRTATTTETVTLDLHAYTGLSSVILEFLYQGTWDWYWEVDDVLIRTRDCVKLPGGAVAGFVEDSNTGEKFVGASVTSVDVATETLNLVDHPGLYWLFQSTDSNPLDVEFTASYPGYEDDMRMVSVAADGITRQDFTLGTAYLTVDPLSLEETLFMDGAGSQTLTINNSGSVAGEFSLFELQSVVTVDIDMILDDGSMENSIGLNGGGQFVWFNRFTPAIRDFPFNLEEVTALFSTEVSVGDLMQVVVYEDDDGDPNTGAVYRGGETFSVTAADDTTWNTFTLTDPILFSDPCDVLIGFVNRTGGVGILVYPAAIDQNSSAGRSWVGAYSAGAPPAEPDLPSDSLWGTIDSFGLPGNWTIRGKGSNGGDDIVWLSETPINGTVLSDGSTDVSINFDAAGLALGDYQARLLMHRPIYNPVSIPVTLHVVDGIIASDQGVVVVEDNSEDITLEAVSSNPSAVLTYEIVDEPQHGDVSIVGDTANYTPDADYYGDDMFTFKASDGVNESNTATVSITVSPVNDIPTGQADQYEVDEDEPLGVLAAGVLSNDDDIDQDVLTAVLATNVSDGTLALNANGSFTYTPDADFYGEDSFTYTACDATDCSDAVTVTITVNAVNDAPQAFADEYDVVGTSELLIAAPGVLVNDTDLDGDSINAILESDVSHGSLFLNNNGSFSYTAHQGFLGIDSFTYKVFDGSETSDAVTVTITVTSIPVTSGVEIYLPLITR